jgi:hypothetical protein
MNKKFFLLLLLLCNSISFAYHIPDVIKNDKIHKKVDIVEPGKVPTLAQLKVMAQRIQMALSTGRQDVKTYAVAFYPGPNGLGHYIVSSSSNGLSVTNFNSIPGGVEPIREIYNAIKDIIISVVCPNQPPSTLNLLLIHNTSNRSIPDDLRMVRGGSNDGRNTGNGIAYIPNRSPNVHAEMAIIQYFGQSTGIQNNPTISLADGDIVPDGFLMAASRPFCANCAGALSSIPMDQVFHGCLLQNNTNGNTRRWAKPVPPGAGTSISLTQGFTTPYTMWINDVVNPTSEFGSARFNGGEFRKSSKEELISLFDAFAVDFFFVKKNEIIKQKDLDRTGKVAGNFKFSMDRANRVHPKIALKFELQIEEKKSNTKWVTIVTKDTIYDALGVQFSELNTPYSFHVTPNIPNGKYRVQATLMNNSDFHYDRFIDLVEIDESKKIKISDKTIRINSLKKSIINQEVANQESKTVESIMNIFPNPAQDYVTAHFTGITIPEGILYIIDIHGKVVLQESIHNKTHIINTNNLANGMYSIRYIPSTNTSVWTKKLIINK